METVSFSSSPVARSSAEKRWKRSCQSIIEQVGGVESLPAALVGAGIAPNDLDMYIEALTVSDKISQALTASGITQENLGASVQRLIVAKAKELGVTVNPRYGKWDGEVADIVPVDSASPAVSPATK